MIDRLQTSDGSHEWLIKPQYKVGTIVSYDNNVDGFIIDEIVGIQCDIGRIMQKASYVMARGSRIQEEQVKGVYKLEETVNGN